MSRQGIPSISDILERIPPGERADGARALVERAYAVAERAHTDQTRKTGGPYIQHPLAVAFLLADLGMDPDTIAAGLLHDVVEDTGVSTAAIAEHFGGEIAEIVDGVTKLERIQFDSREAQQAATMRKMLVAMAKDLRVLVIKLADRLHNMRTLHPLPPADQQRISRETMEIYAPLAGRLGIYQLKWQLEDLAFRSLEPEAYRRIAEMLDARREMRERYIGHVEEVIREELAKQGI